VRNEVRIVRIKFLMTFFKQVSIVIDVVRYKKKEKRATLKY